MSLPERILIATDFSPHAERAARVALHWAERLGAELHWVHGVEHVSRNLPPSAAPLLTGYVEKARQRAQEGLAKAVSDARERGVSSESHLVDAPAAVGVVELARKLSADCVVVGSRGHGRLGRLLLGSVAERITREAPCSVLVVRGDGATESPGTIVLGDDLTDLTEAARRDAFELGARFGARVDVVHAPNLGIPYFDSVSVALPHEVFDQLHAEAFEQLEALRSDAPEGVEITPVIAQDDPAHAICQRADEADAGLVVVGTRSPSDIERVLLGSVAGKVLCHAPCSVLVVR